jgi:aminotransferase
MAVKLAKRTGNIEASSIHAMFAHARGIPDLISFAMGEPDFDTPMHIREAACQAINSGHTHYSPMQGEGYLLEALAQKVKLKNKIEANPSEIVVTIGGSEALTLSMLTAINPGDEVLIPDPFFPPYESVIRFADGIPVRIPTYEENHFRLMPDDVKRFITPKTKAILINTPANPTGSVMTRRELEGIAELAIKHDLLVMADEVYEEFIFDGEHVSIASLDGMKERTYTLNSFSKTYAMTGWRIGYIVAPSDSVEAMVRLHGAYCTNVAAFVQKGAQEALRGTEEPLKEMIAAYGRRRKLVVDGLNRIPGISCIEPQGAFYAFPNIKALGVNGYDFAVDMVKKAGVLTIPGHYFGSSGDGFLRLSYTIPEPKIIEAMERMKMYVESR